MPQFFIYLLKVNIALTLFYMVYRFVLRNLTFYRANRYYLLFAIIFSSVFPLLQFTVSTNEAPYATVVVLRSMPDWNNAVSIISDPGVSWNIWDVLYIVYWAGVTVMLLFFIISIASLVRLWISSRKIPGNEVKLRVVKKNISPFTFWNTIFINPLKHTASECATIIRHESVHVRQRHSFDIMLAELNKILYWFNPGVWMMKNAVRENLEYIADEYILKNGEDKTVYQFTLLQAATGMPVANGITSSFAFTHLKSRIKMMNKKRSAGRNYVRYLFLLPLLATVAIVFAGYRKIKQTTPQQKAAETATVAKTIVYHCIVADAATKQPIPNVRVEDEAGKYLATTNSDGYFTLELPNILYNEGGAGVAVYLTKKEYNKTVSGCSIHSKTTGTGALIGYSEMLQKNAPANIRSSSAFDLSRFTTNNSTASYEQAKAFYAAHSKAGLPETKPEQPGDASTGALLSINYNTPAIRYAFDNKEDMLKVSGYVKNAPGKRPLYIFNGKPVAQWPQPGEQFEEVLVYTPSLKNALAKYGERARYGAIEVTAKLKAAQPAPELSADTVTLVLQNTMPGIYYCFFEPYEDYYRGHHVSRAEWDKLDEKNKHILDMTKYDQKNSVFIGLDNRVMIKTNYPGYDKLKVSTSNGSVSDVVGDIFIARPTTLGNAEIKVYAMLKNGTQKYIGSKVLVSKTLPPTEKYDPAKHVLPATG